MLADSPRVDYVGASDGDQSLIIATSAAPIIFHGPSYMVFHNGSRVVFHDPVSPDIQKVIQLPRIDFAGSADL